MDVLEAIKTRRSIGLVKPDPVPPEYIEQILEAGTYAPNHHRTEPWRFFVLTGEAKGRLGKTFASLAKQGMQEPLTEEQISRLTREEEKPLRAPVLITVAVEPTINHKVIIKEEYAAVSAAIQNMLLAAHALGLGAIWRTGNVASAPEIRDFFGLTEHGEVVGFLYIGFSNISKPLKSNRKHFSEMTTWLDA